jgi:cytochrome c
MTYVQNKLIVLVFSKTKGFRHASIEPGQTALKKMSSEKGFSVNTKKDASLFTEANLKKYNAVIFLNTTIRLECSEVRLRFI